MSTDPISVFRKPIVMIVLFVREIYYKKGMIELLQGTPTDSFKSYLCDWFIPS